ncbi:MAG: DinB family protein [Eudoraea sp.]|jgi:uncharacterized damage-inducible protein DinB|uniref:DinB family protein n=1 Tax=Eudoraea sp. TaxID=1979955 RepID=UPI003C778884
MNSNIKAIIRQLNELQKGKPWVGETFDKKLAAITAKEAFRRPLPQLHSVAELIAHLTSWRKDMILKIQTGKGSLTTDSHENWPTNSELESIGWEKLKEAYKKSLSDVIMLLQSKDDQFLDEHYYDIDFKGTYPYSFAIEGMLHHDIYHLGQMGLVIKLIKENTEG